MFDYGNALTISSELVTILWHNRLRYISDKGLIELYK